jgi:hypothetical protein
MPFGATGWLFVGAFRVGFAVPFCPVPTRFITAGGKTGGRIFNFFREKLAALEGGKMSVQPDYILQEMVRQLVDDLGLARFVAPIVLPCDQEAEWDGRAGRCPWICMLRLSEKCAPSSLMTKLGEEISRLQNRYEFALIATE